MRSARPRLPSRAALSRIALGLAIGAAGGAVADHFHLPLAWMLGALFATMAASIAGLPIAVPMGLRAAFLILVGLFLGESFEGVGREALLRWPFTVLLAILYVPTAAALAYLFYRRVAGDGRMTAVCSAIPGGLVVLSTMSGSLGADERQVALAHSLRVAIVVCLAPVIAFAVLGYPVAEGGRTVGRALASASDLALLCAGAMVAMWVMRRLGMPMPFMVGPLVASAALRLAGVVEGVLPHWLVELALVVTGSAIGARFAGVDLVRLLRSALLSLAGTAILMAVSALFALAAAAITGQAFLPALLAYAPGGAAEMSLIAIAIRADPAFVAVHHLARIVFVLVSVPVMAAWLARHATPAGRSPR